MRRGAKAKINPPSHKAMADKNCGVRFAGFFNRSFGKLRMTEGISNIEQGISNNEVRLLRFLLRQGYGGQVARNGP